MKPSASKASTMTWDLARPARGFLRLGPFPVVRALHVHINGHTIRVSALRGSCWRFSATRRCLPGPAGYGRSEGSFFTASASRFATRSKGPRRLRLHLQLLPQEVDVRHVHLRLGVDCRPRGRGDRTGCARSSFSRVTGCDGPGLYGRDTCPRGSGDSSFCSKVFGLPSSHGCVVLSSLTCHAPSTLTGIPPVHLDRHASAGGETRLRRPSRGGGERQDPEVAVQ